MIYGINLGAIYGYPFTEAEHDTINPRLNLDQNSEVQILKV